MKKFIGIFLIFMSGWVVSFNLAMLIPVNSDYEASWSKIFIAVIATLFGGSLIFENKK